MRIACRDLLETAGTTAGADFDRQLNRLTADLKRETEQYGATDFDADEQQAYETLERQQLSYLEYVAQLRNLAAR
jgi:hypothetical protein